MKYIRFATDGAYLSHVSLDARGKCINTHMIPIYNLQDIVISNIIYYTLGLDEKYMKDILTFKQENTKLENIKSTSTSDVCPTGTKREFPRGLIKAIVSPFVQFKYLILYKI